MKRLGMLFILGLMVISTAAPGFFGTKEDTLSKIQREGKFTVGLDDTFAPMGFRDEEGNIVGFDIDLAKEAARRMGVVAQFKPLDWDGVLFELKSKKVDMVWNGMTITPERSKQIAFSDSYFTGEQIIMTRSGSEIDSLEDLSGRVIGTQLGSTSYFAIEKSGVYDQLKDIRTYSSYVEALLDLEAGRTDAVVIDSMVGRYYANMKAKKDGRDTYDFVEGSLAEEAMGIGMRPEDKTLTQEVNRVMRDMKADGTYNKIYTKWFGDDK